MALAGCAGMPRTSPDAGGFHLRGKLGVVQPDERFSARFLWRQQGEAFSIDLWGPLGQGRLRLVGNPRRLALEEGDGTVISRGTPEAVMMRHLGWSLPLSVLPQWVQGRPARGISATDRSRDEAGRLSRFRQLGWQVELERYRAVAAAEAAAATSAAAGTKEALFLPHRITARRGDYRVRLAVSEWALGAAEATPPAAASR